MSVEPVKLLEWSAEYSVHVIEIDREHEKLFGIVNRLHAAMLAGRGNKILASLLTEITQYTFYHFTHEEQVMASVRYAGRERHVQEHDSLRQAAGAFVGRFERGEEALTIELTLFLSAWLRQHVMTSDLQLGEYINTHGSAFASGLTGSIRGPGRSA